VVKPLIGTKREGGNCCRKATTPSLRFGCRSWRLGWGSHGLGRQSSQNEIDENKCMFAARSNGLLDECGWTAKVKEE
jgi:hypothetical protein